MVVFHHDDADGRCAAAIVSRWAKKSLPEGERLILLECSYANPVPIDTVNDGEQVVIVDFSLKPATMKLLREKTALVTWCDHHESASAYDYAADPEIAGLRDFTDKGFSGCELTWKHFYVSPVPAFISMLGDYDSWRLQQAPACFDFYEGLKVHDTRPTAPLWTTLFGDDPAIDPRVALTDVQSLGKLVIMYRDRYCEGMRESYGYVTSISGYKAYALNIAHFGSKAFGPKFKEFPVCISYVDTGEQFVVSLYSETVNVAEIAKQFGGGGHAGAAGFQCLRLPWVKES